VDVQATFQDGRRRHVGNSNYCHKMGIYHPISMKIVTRTKKKCLLQKSQKRKCRQIYNMTDVASFEIEVSAVK
jgi:hypothetical protein